MRNIIKKLNQMETVPSVEQLTAAVATRLVKVGRHAQAGQIFDAATGELELESRRVPRLKQGRGRGRGRQEDGPNIHGGTKGRDREPQFKVELLCRSFLGDNGIRPLVPGTVFWESPDIIVEGPDGIDKPKAMVPNKVTVRVFNLGLANSTATFVELYSCDPSVGLNAASATLIGSKTVSLIANQNKLVEFSWTPSLDNVGHECLLAHVYDPFNDPVVAPFNPPADRHVAQRNVTVLTADAFQMKIFNFKVANLSNRTMVSELQVIPVIGKALGALSVEMGRELKAGKGARAKLVQEHTAPVNLRAGFAEQPLMRVFREPLAGTGSSEIGIAMGLQLAQNLSFANQLEAPAADVFDRIPGTLAPAARQTVQLRPLTEALMGINIELPERINPGESFTFRVVETVGGVVSGGVTVIVTE